ncbi:hypothetical protein M9Y10_041920 [Tritrichomonas musculus]|uniref:Rab-GAP TBC domain-containing protein n=1 Tax=Tritrichomonas musculus TaxID=1915356 RepID=A0ABR2K7I5_9EUKA
MSQEQSFPVSYLDQKQVEHETGCLKVQHTNGNVTFSFYSTERPNSIAIADSICNLSDFTVFELSTTSPLSITFSGSASSTTFSFKKPEDKQKFMELISTKVRVIRSDLNPLLFLLESIDFGESEFCTILLPNTNTSKPPTRILFTPEKRWTTTKKEKTDGDSTETDKKSDVLYIELNHVTKDNFNEKSESNDFLYNANIDNAVLFDAFKKLLHKDLTPDDAPYDQVKKQWKLIIPRQFANYKNLQELIKNLESDINKHSSLFEKFNPNSKRIMKIAFNILLSYSIYNWDGTFNNKSLIELLFPFLDAYIAQNPISGNESSFDDEKCESEIFTIFDVFYSSNDFSQLNNTSKQPFIKEILPKIGEVLENHFEKLSNLLRQKQVHSLDFLRDDLSRWFVDIFPSDDSKAIQRLWISILSFDGNVSGFFKSFVIALLYYVAPELNELNPLSFEEFVERFNEVKKKVDLITLLDNTRLINEEIKNL